jgi:hypothetical protein
VDRSEEIQDSLIQALTNSKFDLTLLDVNDQVVEWIYTLCDIMHSMLTKCIMDDVQQHNIALGSWVKNAAQAITDQTAACLAGQHA